MKTLYFDTDSNLVLDGPTGNQITQLELTRGDGLDVRLQFVSGGVPYLITSGSTITLGFKLQGAFSAPYAAVATGTDWTVPGSSSGYYMATLALDGNALANYLIDSAGGDIEQIPLGGEITFLVPGGKPRTSSKLVVLIDNDYVKGTEGTPAPWTTYQARAIAIANGADSVAVTFPSAFSAGVVPAFIATVQKSVTGDPNIFVETFFVPNGSTANVGYTVVLSAPTPNGNYVLHYQAVKQTA